MWVFKNKPELVRSIVRSSLQISCIIFGHPSRKSFQTPFTRDNVDSKKQHFFMFPIGNGQFYLIIVLFSTIPYLLPSHGRVCSSLTVCDCHEKIHSCIGVAISFEQPFCTSFVRFCQAKISFCCAVYNLNTSRYLLSYASLLWPNLKRINSLTVKYQ